MPKTRLFALALAPMLLACRPTPDRPVHPPAELAEVEPEPEGPQIHASAIMADIEWLASDERQGRFTLAPEIEEVAGWLAARHAELGLEPVPGAEAMRVGYSLRTGVEAGEGSALAVRASGSGSAKAAKPAAFSPRAEGVAGTAEGQVVFVGYGASWTKQEQLERPDGGFGRRGSGAEGAEGEAGPENIDFIVDAYDDLAGVDVEGKIALVLAHAPNTPDLIAMFAAMQKLAEDFEAGAKPAREADDVRKLEKLHREAREDLADLVGAFVDTKDLGDVYWKVEDPRASLDLMTLASVVMGKAANRPAFNPTNNDFASKAKRLAEAGAVGVIFVEGPRSYLGAAARKAAELPGVTGGGGAMRPGGHAKVLPEPAPIPVVQLRWQEADKLFRIEGQKLSKVQAAIDADYRPRSAVLDQEAELRVALEVASVEVPNVLAQIPGRSDEIVVIGAHFDHIGNDESGNCRAIVRRDTRDPICNGADDNASGTAMLLELARAYRELGVVPERTLVFAHFSGEELGLLGSSALMRESPFDQDRVVAMVNLDMVGRLGPKGLAVGGIHTSADWMPLLDELGNYGMEILYEGSTTTRSDHAWWFRREIPVLFFFTGIHGDYHRAGDHVEDINVEGLASIGQLVGDLTWQLAQGRALAWSLPEGGGIGRGLPGSDPATVIKRVAEDGALIEN